jgi:RNA polymerase sigma factor (sigma-70 family)
MNALEARRARDPYELHRDYVLAVLGRRCGWLQPTDREAIFHDAYTLYLEKQRSGALAVEDMHELQVRAYLTQTALHKALNEGKRAERTRTTTLDDDDPFAAPATDAPDERIAATLDDAPVREIVGELSERRQTIIKLRYYFDCSPEEIQRFMGISERTYRRELEAAMREIGERYETVRQGRWCESRRSLVLAYVSGLAGPDRARKARIHLRNCPGCASMAAELVERTRRSAALLPLPLLLPAAPRTPRAGELVATLRDALDGVWSAAKQHALSLAARADAGTQSSIAAMRPGGVAAVVAGCLAAGTGTYCVTQGIPDSVRSLVVGERTHAPRAQQHQAQQGAHSPAAPQTPAAQQPRQAWAAQRRGPSAQPQQQPRAASRGPASEPSAEFGIEAPQALPPPSPPPPAAAPPSGGGEFGP